MQVCLNGHKITDKLRMLPDRGKQHCSDCGAATIIDCQNCKAPIRGYYHLPGVMSTGPGPKVPAFCHECGRPYPWTESRPKAAQQLAEEVEGLTNEEREKLKASFDDLVRDTPRTTVAATRFKRLATKMGRGAAEGFKAILVDVLSEAAKKLILPG